MKKNDESMNGSRNNNQISSPRRTANSVADPFLQIDQAESELEAAKAQLDAALRRYERCIEKCRVENDRLRAERDAVEIYSEAEVAELLFGDKKHRQRLADIRAEQRLPHRKAGITVLYTREDLAACLEVFAINGEVGGRVKGRRV